MNHHELVRASRVAFIDRNVGRMRVAGVFFAGSPFASFAECNNCAKTVMAMIQTYLRFFVRHFN